MRYFNEKKELKNILTQFLLSKATGNGTKNLYYYSQHLHCAVLNCSKTHHTAGCADVHKNA